ncbi:MAG TPA: EAL domain-containing protein [Polyangiaceae bacterium]|jgi:EAL domain-containing protein (putative c-di-GMP-specific phosphodiesterase class I)|nr:EAL domain-containing protein [Polyangiaceae bacterium]
MAVHSNSKPAGPADGPPLAAGLDDQCRLLLVDDDESVRRTSGRVFRMRGLHVTDVSSGREALERLASESFDAIVSDISMPGMDGIQLLKEIRQRDPHVQVILISGVPTLATAISALDHGAFKYMHKPVDPFVLIENIRRAGGISRLAREEARSAKPVTAVDPEPEDLRRLEASFASALAGATVLYQPVVDSKSGNVSGFEALLRGGDPALADTAAFLHAGARLGRLRDLGRLVRSMALREIRELEGNSLLFLNIHPTDLMDPLLVDWGGELRALSRRVVLELSERDALRDVPQASLRVDGLRKMGFRIAVDNVGAGDAGMSSFSHLEPDFLKLDSCIVRDIHENDAKRRVASAIIGLARELSMTVVAEGVETADESQTLRDLGCDLLQGFLFARPGPAFPTIVWPHAR